MDQHRARAHLPDAAAQPPRTDLRARAGLVFRVSGWAEGAPERISVNHEAPPGMSRSKSSLRLIVGEKPIEIDLRLGLDPFLLGQRPGRRGIECRNLFLRQLTF